MIIAKTLNEKKLSEAGAYEVVNDLHEFGAKVNSLSALIDSRMALNPKECLDGDMLKAVVNSGEPLVAQLLKIQKTYLPDSEVLNMIVCTYGGTNPEVGFLSSKKDYGVFFSGKGMVVFSPTVDPIAGVNPRVSKVMQGMKLLFSIYKKGAAYLAKELPDDEIWA